MMDLLINGKDAFQTWGVKMSEDFVSNILAPAPLKEFIVNESALLHGKQVVYTSSKLADRDVSLMFTVQGDSSLDYMEKYKALVTELQKGKVEIKVPMLGAEVFKLTYLKSTSFAMNTGRTFSKLIISFNEPDPSDRK